jgi:hypothetical protein
MPGLGPGRVARAVKQFPKRVIWSSNSPSSHPWCSCKVLQAARRNRGPHRPRAPVLHCSASQGSQEDAPESVNNEIQSGSEAKLPPDGRPGGEADSGRDAGGDEGADGQPSTSSPSTADGMRPKDKMKTQSVSAEELIAVRSPSRTPLCSRSLYPTLYPCCAPGCCGGS